MSDFNETPLNRPEHHIHNPSEPLPAPREAAPVTDYNENTTDFAPRSAVDSSNIDSQNTSTDSVRSSSAGGQTAFSSERPLGVQPVSEGGVAVGGESDLPTGHAKFGDKVVGKTQKVIGKYTNNPEMHEKGELREAGGKAAVLGEARVPHD